MTITHDILTTASRLASEAFNGDMQTKDIIALAIAEERERCAQACRRIADEYGKWRDQLSLAEIADECAEAIRNPPQPMTGFLAGLTPEQREAALAYEGDDIFPAIGSDTQ